jgi:hypothetical protein
MVLMHCCVTGDQRREWVFYVIVWGTAKRMMITLFAILSEQVLYLMLIQPLWLWY